SISRRRAAWGSGSLDQAKPRTSLVTSSKGGEAVAEASLMVEPHATLPAQRQSKSRGRWEDVGLAIRGRASGEGQKMFPDPNWRAEGTNRGGGSAPCLRAEEPPRRRWESFDCYESPPRRPSSERRPPETPCWCASPARVSPGRRRPCSGVTCAGPPNSPTAS